MNDEKKPLVWPELKEAKIVWPELTEQSLVYRLRERARIRRQIPGRKSVQEGKPDRLADLLEEAANALEAQTNKDSLDGPMIKMFRD